MEERIQKIMSRAGLGSRRNCEELIATGRVKVNGVRAILGTKADPAIESIVVDGRELSKDEPERVYIALNKPRNVLSDSDPDDPRQNVRDLVPVPGHMFTVGRLDFESEGLILMTNDGDLANKLTHPRYGHEKEYRVLLAAPPDEEQLSTWRRGVVLEDGDRTLPAEVFVDSRLGKGAWVRVIMREGRKRQIREICKRIGLPVVRILRVRIGTLRLGDLKPRDWRMLTTEEVNTLRSLQEQPRGRKSNHPDRYKEGDGDKSPSRNSRPFSSRRPFTSNPRKPGSSTRSNSEPSGETSDKPKRDNRDSDWKPNASGAGSKKIGKRDAVRSGSEEKRGHKSTWKPGSPSGRNPATRAGSKPPARSIRKPAEKS